MTVFSVTQTLVSIAIGTAIGCVLIFVIWLLYLWRDYRGFITTLNDWHKINQREKQESFMRKYETRYAKYCKRHEDDLTTHLDDDYNDLGSGI